MLDSSLEAHVLRSDNSSLAKDCRKEIQQLNRQMMKLGPRDRAERRQIRTDLRRLGKEERQRQEAAIVEVSGKKRFDPETVVQSVFLIQSVFDPRHVDIISSLFPVMKGQVGYISDVCCSAIIVLVVQVIKGAQVLCCTLTGVLHRQLANEKFDLVVVDEAAQALEAATWGGLLKAPKGVLAGASLPAAIKIRIFRQDIVMYCEQWRVIRNGVIINK